MRLAAIAVLPLLACTSSGSTRAEPPWARQIPPAERPAWPTRCGIPPSQVWGDEIASLAIYTGRVDPDGDVMLVQCSLHWDHDRDEASSIIVSVAAGRRPLSAADIDPYLDVVLDELRLSDRPVARDLARGPDGRRTTDLLVIKSGYTIGQHHWWISVEQRPRR